LTCEKGTPLRAQLSPHGLAPSHGRPAIKQEFQLASLSIHRHPSLDTRLHFHQPGHEKKEKVSSQSWRQKPAGNFRCRRWRGGQSYCGHFALQVSRQKTWKNFYRP
jgi:hypothetical protein